MHLSIAFFLGLSEILAQETLKAGHPPRQSYQYVFWFEVGLASIALLIMLAFVRLDRAKSDMTADEKERFSRMQTKSQDIGSVSDSGWSGSNGKVQR